MKRTLVADLVWWLVLSVLAAAGGPDPLRDLPAFLLVTGGRIVLLGVVVAVGRRLPPLAVVLLLGAAPWNLAEGLATTSLFASIDPALVQIKLVPIGLLLPAVVWYAYLCGRRMPGRWSLAAFAVVAVAGVWTVLAAGGGVARWITMISGLLGSYALPYTLGVLRRGLLQQRERAARSAEEQARLRERTRIAHDMHDSLGHDLALIAVRAAALELAPGLAPEQARAAGEVRAAAAEATERLRQIVGFLREEGEAPSLTPSGESVAELVERARESGMDVRLEQEGPAPELAHRVVQEGLTNAAKHAPGAPVRVTVTPTLVSVRNGAPARRATVRPGGLGLAGLRERVRLAGATLEARPDGDGFLLAVRLDPP
ncbi:sensor histidine kinase [Nonomuraea sp. NPDC050328]|uniref:sensor histidine kinase n=1 Tax=Nonomuraea sp. NPDC050328 TaxID=3364361 RepID=UPI0037877E15